MFDDDANSCEDPKQISIEFNNYFANVGLRLASKISTPPSQNMHQKFRSSSRSFFINPVVEEEIIEKINKLNANKSIKTNEIPIKFLKIAKAVIAPILTKLINCCIEQGIFPDVLKTAQINSPNYTYLQKRTKRKILQLSANIFALTN